VHIFHDKWLQVAFNGPEENPVMSSERKAEVRSRAQCFYSSYAPSGDYIINYSVAMKP